MDHKLKQYNSRKEWMQAEFDFSDEEVEGLDKFLTGRDCGLVSDFLRSVIGTEDLNNRQKVIISFMMGRFVQETMQEQLKSVEKSMKSIERSMIEMQNLPPDVGG